MTIHDHAEVLARYLEDTREHTLEILRDDGLYRHLRFKKPGSSMYWFDLLTWPGNLLITGDMGSYHFARDTDMFELMHTVFRGEVRINDSYWAEKLQAIDSRDGLREYSEDLFVKLVTEHFEERTDAWPVGAKEALWEQIETDVLEEGETEDRAHQALRDFRGNDFQYHDTWEWNLKVYTYRYLWCCWAIAQGINTYLEHQQHEVSEALAGSEPTA